MKVKRGDIFWINFSKREGSQVIYGTRPVIVVSNDTANHFSPVVSVVPVTQQNKNHYQPMSELPGMDWLPSARH